MILTWLNYQCEQEFTNIILWFCASFLIGVLAYLGGAKPISLLSSLSAIVVILGLICYYKWQAIGWWFILIGLGSGSGVYVTHYKISQLPPPLQLETLYKDMIGTIESIRPAHKGIQLILKDLTLLDKYHNKALATKALIYLDQANITTFNLGDEIQVPLRLRSLEGSILPEGYDFSKHYHLAGLDIIGYGQQLPTVLHANNSLDFYQKLQALRHQIYRKLQTTFQDQDIATFAAALIIGESKGLSKEVMQNMRWAGISHILCVSGLHLTLVFFTCFLALRFLLNLSNHLAAHYNIKVVAAIFAWLGSGLYWLISGMNVATTRSFIMTSVTIAAIILARSSNSLRSLALAVLIILFNSPKEALNPSFQLSFAAVLALVSSYEFTTYYLPNCLQGKGIIKRVGRGLVANIYSSLAVSVATAPIVVYQFYNFPSYTVLANLIAVPITSLYLMPLVILAFILMPFGLDHYILQSLSYGIIAILKTVKYIATLPYCLLHLGAISNTSIALYLISWFWFSLWQGRWRWLSIPPIVIALVLMFSADKADFIFDAKKEILGIKNSQGRLEVYGRKMSYFEQRYWHDWFGQEAVAYTRYPLGKSNLMFTTKFGQHVYFITRKFNCTEAEIIINNIDDQVCPQAKLNITKSALDLAKVILLYCPQTGCYLK